MKGEMSIFLNKQYPSTLCSTDDCLYAFPTYVVPLDLRGKEWQ